VHIVDATRNEERQAVVLFLRKVMFDSTMPDHALPALREAAARIERGVHQTGDLR